jgi:uncharacterized protein YfaS (alpha-2-macroglobulin family)
MTPANRIPPRYVELKVEDRTKRLTVAVSAQSTGVSSAKSASVALAVTDHQNRGTSSEITLWAVDYGVLSLTSYQTQTCSDRFTCARHCSVQLRQSAADRVTACAHSER